MPSAQVESAPHVDGRGQPVDSSCALLLSADFSLLSADGTGRGTLGRWKS
jgi:hypothetical protein